MPSPEGVTFLIRVHGRLHEILRPHIDGAQLVAAMIQVDGTERIIVRQHIGKAIAVAGLHGG
jgi:hypothetical protein